MESAKLKHEEEYGKKPEIVVSTPGRFHLMGEHSWFFKDKTLSMALNLRVYICVSVRDDSALKFYFPQINERKKTTLTALKFKKEDKWANAIKSIIYGFTSGGFSMKGMDITVYSEILPSAGFGITTAIKIGTAWAIREVLSLKCSEAEILQVIERGNRLFLETENYTADNFAAIYSKEGNLLLTDHGKNSYDYIPFNFENKTVILTDARVPRIEVWKEESFLQPENVLVIGELKERKQSVFGGWHYVSNPTEISEVLSVVNEETRRRLLYIMHEHHNVLVACDSLLKGNFGGFAYAVNESHENLRDLYDASCPEIDWILKRVSEINPNPNDLHNPYSCGRITGKGFGRCVYTIIDNDEVENYKKKLNEYGKIFGFKSEFYIVKPSDGVKIL